MSDLFRFQDDPLGQLPERLPNVCFWFIAVEIFYLNQNILLQAGVALTFVQLKPKKNKDEPAR